MFEGAVMNVTKWISDTKTPLTNRQQIAAVCILAWPAIIEQIMITMVQYVDTAMVGSLGSNATASVGLTASTIWLFGGIFSACGVGFSVQVAHSIGAGRIKEAKSITRQAILFNLLFGIFISSIGVILSFFLPGMLGADPAIREDASVYFRIISYSMPFLLASNLLSAIIRCSGDTKTPMLLNTLINILNIILNFLFIYPTRTISIFQKQITVWGLGLGVKGAAIGSALSTCIVSILLLLVIYKKDSPIQISLRGNYHFTKSCLQTASRLGVPVFLERAALCVAQIYITVLITVLGTISVAANHLAVTAEALSYLPAMGIASAATALVGQSLGAGKPELAVRFSRISVAMGFILMTFSGVLLYLFAPQLISLFTKEQEVILLGAAVLRIDSFAQPLFSVSIVATGALRGAGDSKYPFLINLVSMWGVRIVVATFITSKVGLKGVWIAMCIELWVRGLIFLWRLCSNKWLYAYKQN